MYTFYCLSYKNEERERIMNDKFVKIGIDCKVMQGASDTDPRMHVNKNDKAWSCMYGHLDMINDFLKTDNEYGIFCEDDIKIHKDILNLLPQIIDNFKKLELDVLLLGYLLPFVPNTGKEQFTYHDFTNDTWGTQMYMLSRKQCKYLIDNYYYGYADQSFVDPNLTPFSSDWIITKKGNRALISPPIAVENGEFETISHLGQRNYHVACFQTHYNKDVHI